MDDIYLKNKECPSVSEHIEFSEYFEKYSQFFVSTYFYARPTQAAIMTSMQIDAAKYEELLKTCDPTELVENEPGDVKYPISAKGFRSGFKWYEIPEGTKLHTLKYLKERNKKTGKKHRGLFNFPGQVDLDPKVNLKEELARGGLVPLQEYVFNVRVHCPSRRKYAVQKHIGMADVSQEFIITSSMTLEKLRDRIKCTEDFMDVMPDISENPFTLATVRTGEVYRSGLFYIGNKFYIDMRLRDNIDYSEIIKEWSDGKPIKFEGTERMEKTKVNSLSFRLGFPYLYLHQGSCEHLVVFTDARLLHPLDVRVLGDYPIMKSFSVRRGKVCGLCGVRGPKYIASDCDRLVDDHTFLCITCMKLYLYKGTTKLGNFVLRRYVDRVSIL